MKKILYLFLALASYGIFAQTTAEEYLNSAVSKFYLDDMKGAIVDYNEAIKIDPNNVEAYRKRGIAKESLKDFSGAIVDYTKAIEIDSNYGHDGFIIETKQITSHLAAFLQ